MNKNIPPARCFVVECKVVHMEMGKYKWRDMKRNSYQRIAEKEWND